jgi:hypothetical protein
VVSRQVAFPWIRVELEANLVLASFLGRYLEAYLFVERLGNYRG